MSRNLQVYVGFNTFLAKMFFFIKQQNWELRNFSRPKCKLKSFFDFENKFQIYWSHCRNTQTIIKHALSGNNVLVLIKKFSKVACEDWFIFLWSSSVKRISKRICFANRDHICKYKIFGCDYLDKLCE